MPLVQFKDKNKLKGKTVLLKKQRAVRCCEASVYIAAPLI